MDTLQCPACGMLNPTQAIVCQECGEDLSTIKSVMDTANRHYNEALALAQGGRLDEAIGQLEAAIAMSSHNLNYHLLLGTVYAQKKSWDEAIFAWERCLIQSPETEKAYRNIEKANQFMEEESTETRNRPFYLTAVASVLVSVFLLFTTGFYAYQAYSKNSLITSLINTVNEKTNEANTWQQKFTTLNANFPEEGLQGLIAQLTQTKALADQRATSIEQLEKKHKEVLEQRNQEILSNKKKIQELQATIDNQKQTIAQINPLRHNLNAKNKEVETLQKTVDLQNETMKTGKEQIDQLTKQIAEFQTKLNTSRESNQTSVQQVRTDYDSKIEAQRKQIQTLLDEVAEKDRVLADIQYANQLILESDKLMQTNQFDDAASTIQKALERRKDDPLALYYQQNVQSILRNPIEKEMRIELNARQSEIREQIRSRITSDSISRARNYLDQGSFEKAIATARQTRTMLPSDSKDAQQCDQLIQEAQEIEATVTRQLSEARGYIEKKDYRKAKTLLKDILKRAPSFEEANTLLKEIES